MSTRVYQLARLLHAHAHEELSENEYEYILAFHVAGFNSEHQNANFTERLRGKWNLFVHNDITFIQELWYIFWMKYARLKTGLARSTMRAA